MFGPVHAHCNCWWQVSQPRMRQVCTQHTEAYWKKQQAARQASGHVGTRLGVARQALHHDLTMKEVLFILLKV